MDISLKFEYQKSARCAPHAIAPFSSYSREHLRLFLTISFTISAHEKESNLSYVTNSYFAYEKKKSHQINFSRFPFHLTQMNAMNET